MRRQKEEASKETKNKMKERQTDDTENTWENSISNKAISVLKT